MRARLLGVLATATLTAASALSAPTLACTRAVYLGPDGRVPTGCTMAASFTSRRSGTGTTPTLESMVQKG